MVVVVDVCAHCRIVVIPLCAADRSIFVSVPETAQELNQNFFLCHLACAYLRMLSAVEDGCKVCRSNNAVSCQVEFRECFIDDCLSCPVGLTTNSDEELVKVNNTVLICVHGSEQHLSLMLGDVRS